MTFEEYLPAWAIKGGLVTMGAQAFFMILFTKVLPSGPWSELPGVTAHQLVCLFLMMHLVYEGVPIWLREQEALYNAGMEGRIFGVSPDGRDLGSLVWGMMLIWDIPTSIFVPSLQDVLMLAHHVGMTFVAGVSMGIFSSKNHPIGSYYAPFFFGVVELSTIFLTIIDLFHPKNKAWNRWLNESPSTAAKYTRVLNEILRPTFALAFLLVRCTWFPYVMATTCLRDFWNASLLETDEDRHGVSSLTFKAVFVLSLLFTLLQLHWGILVSRQIVKALGLIPSKKAGVAKRD